MDPNIALSVLIAAATSGDADLLRTTAEDLAEWLEKGGFPPTGEGSLDP